MDSAKVKPCKRHFAVPVQSNPEQKKVEEAPSEECSTNEQEAFENTDACDLQDEFKAVKGDQIITGNLDIPKNKPKKYKHVGFTAPKPTPDSSGDGTILKDNVKSVKMKKRKNPKLQSGSSSADAQPPQKKKKENKKGSRDVQSEFSMTAMLTGPADDVRESSTCPTTEEKDPCVQPRKQKKAPVPTKPVRSLTDEEYDKIFEAALERVLQQSAAAVEIQFVTSTEDTAEVAASGNLVQVEDHADVLIEDENVSNQDSTELIQHENEITPTVSETEASNITKSAALPIKPKKTAVPKKKLHPKQLLSPGLTKTSNTGKEESNKENINLYRKPHKIKPKKREHKLKKQHEMLNRDIEELGTWVQCVNPNCVKWRHLKDVPDPSVLPERWMCDLNSEELYNSCDKPEEDFDESIHQETFIYTHFVEGSVVWAKMVGYPWWPAMVEIDPDMGEYFDSDPANPMQPTHYHVVFFDNKVSRAWIRTTNVRNFTGEIPKQLSFKNVSKGQSHRKEIDAAKKNAEEALTYSLKERLKKFSFSARFKGRWGFGSDEEQVSSQDHLPQEPENKPKPKKSCKRRRIVQVEYDNSGVEEAAKDNQSVGLHLNLHGTVIDEILDNVESILSNAEDLCEVGETLVGCEVDGKTKKKKKKSKKSLPTKDEMPQSSGNEVMVEILNESHQPNITDDHSEDSGKSVPKEKKKSKQLVQNPQEVKKTKKKISRKDKTKIKSTCTATSEVRMKKKFKVTAAPNNDSKCTVKVEQDDPELKPVRKTVEEDSVPIDSQAEELQSLLSVKVCNPNEQNNELSERKEDKTARKTQKKIKQHVQQKVKLKESASDGASQTKEERPSMKRSTESDNEMDVSTEYITITFELENSNPGLLESDGKKGDVKDFVEKDPNVNALAWSPEKSDHVDADDEVDLTLPKDPVISKTEENSDPFEACEE